MKTLFITEPAKIEGYNGATLRYKNTIAVLWDYWYEAPAVDEEGNKYTVYFKTVDGWNLETDDECDACDWSTAWMVTSWDTDEDINEDDIILNWDKCDYSC